MSENGKDKLICRCEEVTEEEILAAIESGCRTVTSIKRMTRAGMGACQGRCCGRLIQQILLREHILTPDEIAPDKGRFPIVPCSVESLMGSENIEE